MEKGQLDPYTFGDSQAAVNLADMLGKPEYKSYARKVSCALGSFNEVMVEINGIRNISVRAHLCKLIMEDAERRADSTEMPKVVKTHMLNVMAKAYKIQVRTYRGMIINNDKDEKKRDREREAEKLEKN